jgi:hypothetical protein
MENLTVILQDRPGRPADLGEASGNAAISIEDICGAQEGAGAGPGPRRAPRCSRRD